ELKVRVGIADGVKSNQPCRARLLGADPARDRGAASGGVYDPAGARDVPIVEPHFPARIVPPDIADLCGAVAGPRFDRRGLKAGVEPDAVEAPARSCRAGDEIRRNQGLGIPRGKISADARVRFIAPQ